AMDGNEVVDAFERGEIVSFEIDGTMIELEKDDVLTALIQKPGYVAESDGAYTVVLDTNLTEELINEGFVREVISKVQTMRKEAGFEVTDRIRLTWQTTEKLEKILENGKSDLMRAVLAVEAECAEADEGAFVREMKINGENATLAVSVKN
ncbi:MAG: isoleucine--tRNA ligase, partial [Clostridia bacterium]|nr:isoleucine--tRNA ligase [Clostridia bacterium]